jgi:hypothetical protein
MKKLHCSLLSFLAVASALFSSHCAFAQGGPVAPVVVAPNTTITISSTQVPAGIPKKTIVVISIKISFKGNSNASYGSIEQALLDPKFPETDKSVLWNDVHPRIVRMNSELLKLNQDFIATANKRGGNTLEEEDANLKQAYEMISKIAASEIPSAESVSSE